MVAALIMKVTAAGRAALRNADGTGSRAVTVASVGVTATAFVPGATVPDEIKRITTIAGGATAPDTIHVTISDVTDGAKYSVRGFGLYLNDGTLFASYGQADVIVEKSAQAAMLLSVDTKFADIDATLLTFGDTNFSNPQATTERVGVVELSTSAEAITGTDDARAITPKALVATLDDRLGAGAPTTFVKKLLALATAAAIRFSLEIKGAALYDTGAGNKLDADMLDGQQGTYYLSWNNFQDLPATFPPGPHTHSADDISSGTFPVQRGGTGLPSIQPGYFLVGAAKVTDPLVVRSPEQVRGDIGAAAKSHSHAITDVTGLGDALAGKAAAKHTHAIDAVDGLSDALAKKLDKAGGTVDGNLGIGMPGSAQPSGRLDVRTGYGGFVLRSTSFSPGITEAVFDAINNDNSNFGPMNMRGTYFSFMATSGSRVLFRGDGNSLAIDSVDVANGAFSRMGLTATEFNFNGGGVNVRNWFNATGQVNFGQNIVSNTANVVVATGSPGTLYLRPNGVGVVAGQAYLDAGGSLNLSGWLTASQNIGSATSSLVLFAQGGGGIYLRPNGAGSTYGQAFFDGNGNLAVQGVVQSSAGFNVNGVPVLLRSDFTSARGDTGWLRHPDGTIEQWGTYFPDRTWPEGTGPTIYFPRAFPNGCDNVSLTDINDGAVGWDFVDCTAQLTAKNGANFSTYIQNPSSNGRNNWRGMTWRAIGY